MAFFNSFTDSIKQKWLQFFQVNRDWITLQMAIESVYTPDGGKRPSSYLILGVVNALEPKLAQLMFPFAKLNPDADTLIEVLDLHFDPDIVLGNRLSPTTEPKRYLDVSEDIPEVLEDIAEDVLEEEPSASTDLSDVGEEDIDQEFTMIDVTQVNWDESNSLVDDNAFDEISLADASILEESEPASSVETVDEFSGISFESMTLSEDNNASALGDLNLSDDNGFDDLGQPEESAFRDVLSDVWGDEKSLQEGEENNDLLGEELPSEVFDESEMARLFPNN
ncbi:DUF5331 domain-containing protein [Anabaena cylindrica FACHB-243]|uniref:DUF5331 domain-containing protein n=1 Tax=Anabaena cylindrica (strain ATCC 27899 / PCC 7122) TaxID=272123 RepID=K9ZLL7_ANACC|nr:MULTISPECIES: DUF5331 domain-containing protein [Anabaena]AFZ59437.1 hypothetical protein Anacy_4068 [Anabaena cylindrica PCC 7122]MBD2417591.1 DUF5331 domain-containing protein [Anabaena cylindrica FACHB-243]MBY5283217.1 DUF5331 domain-containing protein [Anabaena sp. CCAP 1446/1C]MBY5307706.1 DUF5331 domain-containing protein [Anabaena sp. CCAP 1446/1C]MCM2405353.1 DUF5331 domain-containing protein [Anabaena sp. CCAP 1446/1C]